MLKGFPPRPLRLERAKANGRDMGSELKSKATSRRARQAAEEIKIKARTLGLTHKEDYFPVIVRKVSSASFAPQGSKANGRDIGPELKSKDISRRARQAAGEVKIKAELWV